MTTSVDRADAVLKLQLGKEGPIRRIPIKLLIENETGIVSYSKLIDLVIEHHRTTNAFPKDTSPDALPEGFQTQFSYQDEDGDIVTISSDHELADAFQQLTSKAIPILRVLATTTFAIPSAHIAPPAPCIMDPLTGKLMEAGSPVYSEHRIKSDVSLHHKKKHVFSAMESVAEVLISAADRLVAAVETIQPLPSATKKELYDNMNRLVATTDSKLQKKHVVASLQNIAGSLIATVDRLVDTVDVIQPLPPAAKKELMETMDHLVKTTGTKLQKKQVEAALESVATNLVATVDRLVTTVEGIKLVQQESYVSPKASPNSAVEVPNVVNSTVDDSPKVFEDSSIESKMKKRQILHALENLASILIATVDRLVNSVEAIRPSTSASSNGKAEVAGRSLATEESGMMATDNGCVNENSILESSEKVETDTDPENYQAPHVEGFDPNFIHGRHTCDNCFTSPIIGIRYHAINRPDYDLCSKCVSKYRGKNISFEPMELERDRVHQARWKQRQGKCRFHHIPKPGYTSENFDEALKEAIRRSLEEATPVSTELSFNEEQEEEGDIKVNPAEATAVVVVATDENLGNTKVGNGEELKEAKEESVRGVDASCVLVPPSSESHSGKSVDQMDWELLNDSHPVDTEVAFATEVLGSKLFLNVDSQMSADSISISQSVTPELSSSSRWEKELNQLDELGFMDKNVNVEALETLEAANIGVESIDPVTVEQVVDYLLKKTN